MVVEAAFDRHAFSDAEFKRHSVALPDSVAGAVAKRKAEFLAGRLCARRALVLSGFEETAVAVGEGRAPRWPAGAVGSITHTEGVAAAVVARGDAFAGLGIDYERVVPPQTADEVAAMILTVGDRRFPPALPGWSAERFFTTIFSLKESLFKALYPRVGRFFDFQAAELCALAEEEAVLRLLEPLSAEFPRGREFRAFHYYSEGMVRTLVSVPLGEPGEG
ncbi:4'-phosphopantetheinyl transferase superfamily protein [Endothiovibrio diazotrophicus]